MCSLLVTLVVSTWKEPPAFPRGIRGPPERRPRLERRGRPPACTGAAPPAPRIARTADQRPPLPRHVAPRRSAAPRARLQRRPARRAPAAAEPPVGLRQGRRARARHRPRGELAEPRRRARPGATGAARWFIEQLAPYGYQVRQEHFTRRPRGPRPRPRSSTSSRSGPAARQKTILLMAHRDDAGSGAGANDNASGTAALLELARAYAPAAGTTQVPPPVHARLPLDGRRRRRRRSARRGSRRTPPRRRT